MSRDFLNGVGIVTLRRISILAALAFLLLLVSAASHARADADDDPNHYRVPLVSGWYVERPATWDKPFSSDAFLLTNGQGYTETSPNFIEFNEVSTVKRVAVSGTFIVGETKSGYFLLDTLKAADEVAEKFKTLALWQAALTAAGINNVQLQTPEVLASKLPDKTLRPWNYTVMRGLFGLDDGTWSATIIIAGMVLLFSIGCLNRRKRFLGIYAIVLGVAFNVVANGIIAGTGPDTFVGFCGGPLVFFVCVYVGFGARRGVIYFTRHRKTTAILQ